MSERSLRQPPAQSSINPGFRSGCSCGWVPQPLKFTTSNEKLSPWTQFSLISMECSCFNLLSLFLILPLCVSALLCFHNNLLAGIGRLLLKAVLCAGWTSPVPAASPRWINVPASSRLFNLLQFIHVFLALEAHMDALFRMWANGGWQKEFQWRNQFLWLSSYRYRPDRG